MPTTATTPIHSNRGTPRTASAYGFTTSPQVGKAVHPSSRPGLPHTFKRPATRHPPPGDPTTMIHRLRSRNASSHRPDGRGDPVSDTVGTNRSLHGPRAMTSSRGLRPPACSYSARRPSTSYQVPEATHQVVVAARAGARHRNPCNAHDRLSARAGNDGSGHTPVRTPDTTSRSLSEHDHLDGGTITVCRRLEEVPIRLRLERSWPRWPRAHHPQEAEQVALRLLHEVALQTRTRA